MKFTEFLIEETKYTEKKVAEGFEEDSLISISVANQKKLKEILGRMLSIAQDSEAFLDFDED